MFEEFNNEQEIIDRFIQGEITPLEFLDLYFSNKSLSDKLDKMYEIHRIKIFKNPNSSLFSLLKEYMNDSTLGLNINVYGLIYKIIDLEFGNVEEYTKWNDDYNFYLQVTPECLDGEKNIENYIYNEILVHYLDDKKTGKLIKFCKEEIKKAFYIEGNKYPHWIQSSEWPLSKTGKPTKYLRTENRHGGEVKAYIFLDVDTNEEITVEQCY